MPPRPTGLAGALARGERLFNEGLYFECHELLEDSWRAAGQPWKACLQGLIQIAAGFHKLKTHPDGPGGPWVIRRGLQKILAPESPLAREAATGTRDDVERFLETRAAGSPSPAPRMRWRWKPEA